MSNALQFVYLYHGPISHLFSLQLHGLLKMGLDPVFNSLVIRSVVGGTTFTVLCWAQKCYQVGPELLSIWEENIILGRLTKQCHFVKITSLYNFV